MGQECTDNGCNQALWGSCQKASQHGRHPEEGPSSSSSCCSSSRNSTWPEATSTATAPWPSHCTAMPTGQPTTGNATAGPAEHCNMGAQGAYPPQQQPEQQKQIYHAKGGKGMVGALQGMPHQQQAKGTLQQQMMNSGKGMGSQHVQQQQAVQAWQQQQQQPSATGSQQHAATHAAAAAPRPTKLWQGDTTGTSPAGTTSATAHGATGNATAAASTTWATHRPNAAACPQNLGNSQGNSNSIASLGRTWGSNQAY